MQDPEPKIELDAESRFEGKNIQQVTSLILRHFKKLIRRKYILPNYVIRYKPLLMVKVPQDEQHGIYIHNSQVTVGTVVVKAKKRCTWKLVVLQFVCGFDSFC